MNLTQHVDWNWEALDYQLANFLSRVDKDNSLAVEQAVKILSHEVRQGHVCIWLDDFSDIEVSPSERTIEVADWRRSLLKSSAIGQPGDLTPLILDESNHLYFHRYWQYEQQLAAALKSRVHCELETPEDSWFDQQFKNLPLSEQQQEAVKKALSNNFSIISGGPGTGKTTTIASLLLLLNHFDPDARVGLAAPTGKAAMRMQEAMLNSAEQFDPADAVLLETQAQTLHRLLGYQSGKVTFRYQQSNPLPYSVVIVDEASMIDLALMNKLVSAVAKDARLILIGDRHQLASVEAGSVFGDICIDRQTNVLSSTLTLLTKSYRFSTGQGIEQLSKSINAGNSDAVIEILSSTKFPEIEWLNPEVDSIIWQQQLKTKVFQQLDAIKSAPSSAEKFANLSHFQLLCAHQKGRFGVAGISSAIDDWIQKKYRLADKIWYAGKPLMIKENDYQTKLFNGDFGLVVAEKEQKFRVVFQSSNEHSQSLSISRLPAHENAWAISVHKSQGSEFDEVMLVLPESPSPVISRELLYTAVTRAKSKITIVSNEKVLRHAIEHQIQRRSGLANGLSVENKELKSDLPESQLNLF